MFLGAALLGCGRESKGISGQIPNVTLKTHLGESFTLGGESKDATLLVFWATWCGPCMMEIPSLIELQEKYQGRPFRIISINLDDPEGKKVKEIAANYGINYPVLLGTDQTAKQFGGVNALPTSFLIGTDGKIKEKVQGLLPEEELERKIQQLLAGAS
jgi:thiol-disulfide isomerase/thioredoxin